MAFPEESLGNLKESPMEFPKEPPDHFFAIIGKGLAQTYAPPLISLKFVCFFVLLFVSKAMCIVEALFHHICQAPF